jgi:two-component system sensor histidine kinase HydH
VLEDPRLRKQSGLDVAETDEEVAAALALFHSPVLERLGALVFAHDDGGHMDLDLAVSAWALQGRGQITQIVVNLVRNACDALEQTVGARVVVSVVELDGFAELRVDDNGPGIPPEVFARLFEPFFTTKGEDGTGLGLSVCAGIAQDRGGELVASESPLGGARSTLRIPLCDPPEPDTGDRVAAQMGLLG